MSRIIAIDYGRKRTGIAVSDTLQMIANGLTTVPTHQLLQFLLDYVAKEPVERILVGFPKQMNNEASENMKNIAQKRTLFFLQKFQWNHCYKFFAFVLLSVVWHCVYDNPKVCRFWVVALRFLFYSVHPLGVRL